MTRGVVHEFEAIKIDEAQAVFGASVAGDIERVGQRKLKFAAIGEPGQRIVQRLVFQFLLDFMRVRSEEHTSELQSLMRISYAVFCFKKKTYTHNTLVIILTLSN